MDTFADYYSTLQGAFTENQKAFQQQAQKFEAELAKTQAEQTAGFISSSTLADKFLKPVGKLIARKLGFSEANAAKVMTGEKDDIIEGVVNELGKRLKDKLDKREPKDPGEMTEEESGLPDLEGEPVSVSGVEEVPEEFQSLESFKDFFRENLPNNKEMLGDDALDYLRNTFKDTKFSLDEAKSAIMDTLPEIEDTGISTLGDLATAGENVLKEFHSQLPTTKDFQFFKDKLMSKVNIDPNAELTDIGKSIAETAQNKVSGAVSSITEQIPEELKTTLNLEELNPSTFLKNLSLPELPEGLQLQDLSQGVSSIMNNVKNSFSSSRRPPTVEQQETSFPSELKVEGLATEDGGKISLASTKGVETTGEALEGVEGAEVGAEALEGADVALETAATAAEATTSVLPVIGEFAVPLIALGTSLASIFIKPKKAKQTPVINPSFQFL